MTALGRRIVGAATLVAVVALHGACAPAERAPQGVVLINLSGLRLDALEPGGGGEPIAPVLAALADRSVAYENALAASSEALAAQTSLLSGLYPREHRVTPPDAALTAEWPVIAETFRDFGFRTVAFTAGGYAVASFGIDRGFDDFHALEPSAAFAGARSYLAGVSDARFFLYLHVPVPATMPVPEGGPGLDRWVAGFEKLGPDRLDAFRAAYREGVRSVDAGVGRLLDELGSLALDSRTVVLVVSDRGFELGEHGRVGPGQLYPESLRVPLLLRVPGEDRERRTALVQTVDVASSLYALARLAGDLPSGRLLPGVTGSLGQRGWAAAEVSGRQLQAAFVVDSKDGSRQLVETRLRGDYDGTWVTRTVAFDTDQRQLDFSIVSYPEPRSVSVTVDGEFAGAVEAATNWGTARLVLPAPGPGAGLRRRVLMSSAGCAAPGDRGHGADHRCLSFKLKGLELSRAELFDLGLDPAAERDLCREAPTGCAEMRARWLELPWRQPPRPDPARAAAAELAAIAARGDHPEPPYPSK